MEKKCSKCNFVGDESFFSKSNPTWCKQCNAAYHREYRKRDSYKKWYEVYYEINQERIAELQRNRNKETVRRYHEKNKEVLKAKRKVRYELNRLEVIEKYKAYYQLNREQVLAKQKEKRRIKNELKTRGKAIGDQNNQEHQMPDNTQCV